jgi:hypothetical protein
MTKKRVAGMLAVRVAATVAVTVAVTVALTALAWVGCKKKPKGTDDKSAMTAMDVMRPATPMDAAMRPAAMRAAPQAGMTTLALKMEKPGGMIVIPKGKNPLAGVDISKGFGEGWFKKGDPPGTNQPSMPATPAAMTPAAPVAMTPGTAPGMAPAMTPAMTPAAMTATPGVPAAKPQPLPYTQYVHPDKSFAFRHPTGWTPKVKVGKIKGVPTFIIQVRKDTTQTGPGELGALAFVLPKKGPDSKVTCQQMIAIVKKTTPSLQTGPLKPLQQTGLYMFRATSMEGNQKQVSLAICGTAHQRIMILSYFTIGQPYANHAYGYQLGLALQTFTSDLLKK